MKFSRRPDTLWYIFVSYRLSFTVNHYYGSVGEITVCAYQASRCFGLFGCMFFVWYRVLQTANITLQTQVDLCRLPISESERWYFCLNTNFKKIMKNWKIMLSTYR